MVIKCDIDNVINNLCIAMFDIYNKKHEKKIQYDQCVEYDFSCFDKDTFSDLYAMFSDKEMWDALKPTKYSQTYLKRLNELGDLILVTATDACNFEWKVNWIKQYFPFINDYQIWRDNGIDRHIIWSDFAIDDCQTNFDHEMGTRILIDAPWNKSVRTDNETYFRAKDLREAYEIIERVKTNNGD